MIELLVVIAIISMLVSILIPSLNKAKEIANRAKCAANLRSIGIGMALYSEINGSYPYIPLNGAGWGVSIGTSRDSDPFDGVARNRSVTSNLYLLVREAYCPAGMFTCPSTDERKAGDDEPDLYWDFVDGEAVSLSVMNPYGSVRNLGDTDSSTVLLADASPYFDPATGLRNSVGVADLSGNPDSDTIRQGNSVNHRGAGQNVMLVGGSAKFHKRADCGVNGDNIYTRADTDEGTDAGGSIPAPGADGSNDDQGPAGPKDVYLVP